jgi:chromate transporter
VIVSWIVSSLLFCPGPRVKRGAAAVNRYGPPGAGENQVVARAAFIYTPPVEAAPFAAGGLAGIFKGAIPMYLDIFMAFLRIGLFGYGGGPGMLPLIEKEVVNTYGWLTPEQFVDTVAMGMSLPGPIATKMALSIGLQVGGPLGALIAIAATLLPSTVLIIVFTVLYYKYRHLTSIQGIVKGVRPVVIALLLVTVANLSPKAVLSWDTFVIALAAFAAVFFLKVHPIYTIVVAAVIGVWFYR